MWKILSQISLHWNKIQFSPDGEYILAITNGSVIYVIKAFPPYKVLQQITVKKESGKDDISGGFSPDGQYVFATGSDQINWFKIEDFIENKTYNNGYPSNVPAVCVWSPSKNQNRSNASGHVNTAKVTFTEVCGNIHAAKFNPVYSMFATGGTTLNFWIPTEVEGGYYNWCQIKNFSPFFWTSSSYDLLKYTYLVNLMIRIQNY